MSKIPVASETSTATVGRFRDRVLAKGRIGKGDVAALRAACLADGLSDRDEAALLLALDRRVPSIHPSWTDFLVAAVVDFAVWGSRPTGRIDEETALWLAAALAGGAAPTRRGQRVAGRVLEEAESCHPTLAALALGALADAEAEPCAERMAA